MTRRLYLVGHIPPKKAPRPAGKLDAGQREGANQSRIHPSTEIKGAA